MFRKTQILFRATTILTDILSVSLAFAFVFSSLAPGVGLLFLAGLTAVSMGFFGEYSLERRSSLFVFAARFLISFYFGFALSGYFLGLPGAVFVDFALLGILSVSFSVLWRSLFYLAEMYYYKSGRGRIPVFIVGMSRGGEAFLHRAFESDRLARFDIRGFFDNSASKEEVVGVPYLGKLVELEREIQQQKPQAIIQAGLTEQMITVTSLCQTYNLEYFVLPSLIGAFGKKVTVKSIAGAPFVTVKETNLAGWGHLYKRAFDLVFASLLLLLLSPVFLLVFVALVIERKTIHVLVREERVDGRKNEVFDMLRFVTLRNGESEPTLNSDELKLHSEGMIKDKGLELATPLGVFLRKTELNELPQLFNVLGNTMSLIGPRAPFKEEIAHYTNFHSRRLRLKPGITGMWQVSKEHTKGTHDELLAQDIYYVENWSLWLDVLILGRTGWYVVRKLFRV